MTGDELRVLCDDITFSTQFDNISDIAEHEGWSFAFLKDGSACFAMLSGPKAQSIQPSS